MTSPPSLSYVLPLRREATGPGGLPAAAREAALLDDLTRYLADLRTAVDDVIVVDGSPPAVFAGHRRRWGGLVRHLPPGPGPGPRDKVAGVTTGARAARHGIVVVADDDVRWSAGQLAAVARRMDGVDLLRPQNRFDPAPWHARWDTARSLLNRAVDGDWPGTLVVRREALRRGYAPGVLFENLELVRTVRGAGGRTALARDVVVCRRPPEVGWFLRQRVRQAYDELARPWRLALQLAILPAVAVGGRRAVAALAVASVAVAEVGRRRGGRDAFPATAPLWAPAWLAERAVCAWLALGARAAGGARYRGRRVKVAAHSTRALREVRAATEAKAAGPARAAGAVGAGRGAA